MGEVLSKCCRAAFKDPTVTLKGMTMHGSNLVIVMSIQNPNPFKLDIHSLTYRVSRAKDEEVEVAAGELTKHGLKVKAHDSKDAKATLSLSLGGLGAVSRSICVKGHTEFVVRGVLSIGGSAHKLADFPFKFKGSVVLYRSKSFDTHDTSDTRRSTLSRRSSADKSHS